jgi:hypothetical protein
MVRGQEREVETLQYITTGQWSEVCRSPYRNTRYTRTEAGLNTERARIEGAALGTHVQLLG